MPSRPIPWLPLLLLAAMGACSSFRTRPSQTAAQGDGANLISSTELSDPSIAGLTAHDAVLRLRPGFLIDRTAGRTRSSTPIQVSVNGGQLGQLNSLMSIPVGEVGEIRYLTAADASTRFGVRTSTGPVILVTMRSR